MTQRAPSTARRGLLKLAAASGLAAALPWYAAAHAADQAQQPEAPPLELVVLGSGGPGAVGRACLRILGPADIPASASQRVLQDEDGLRITFSGDFDSRAHAALRRLARDTSLLVCNAAVLDPPASPAHLHRLHTAPQDIAAHARDAGAGRLLLAHLTPIIDNNKEQVLASIARSWPARSYSPGTACTCVNHA